VQRSFLQSYLAAFHEIEGWFSFDAALIFMAYANVLREHGIAGDVLEIGVYHGLSSIAVAALRGQARQMHVVDLFEDQQEKNISQAGIGNREHFNSNLQRFYPTLDFLRVIPRVSSDVHAQDFTPTSFSLCHVDGGHSREETFHDLSLSVELLMPGGVVAVDDYFNASFPGVAEGCIQFFLEKPGQLRPLFIGYNKVLFQKLPGPELNAQFLSTFPKLKYQTVQMWSLPVILSKDPVRFQLDLYSSTPDRLIPMGVGAKLATLKPRAQMCRATGGGECKMSVMVANTSEEAFPKGERVFGLSYHLLAADGRTLSHDNDRTWLLDAMVPGEERTVTLTIKTPLEPGDYKVEIDLVWEGVMWFADAGNPTAIVDLTVS
jgi:hypothetical protein